MKREDRLIENLNKGRMLQEYGESRRTICPYCGSKNIQREDDDYSTWEYYSRVYCLDCDAEWDEVYTLTAIYEIIGPDPRRLEKQSCE